MGRDLRIVGYNRNVYPDRCWLYGSEAVKNNKLVKDAKPICRFNKKDIVPFKWERATVNGIVTATKQFVGTIETSDHVEEARPDFFVVDQTGALFIIVEIPMSNDLDRTKVVGTRPAVITRMVLKGIV